MADSDFKKGLITLCSAIIGAIIGGLVFQWNPISIFEGYTEGWGFAALFIYLQGRKRGSP